MFKLEKELMCMNEELNKYDYHTIIYIGKDGYKYCSNHEDVAIRRTKMKIMSSTLSQILYEQVSGKVAVYIGKFENWRNLIINLPIPKNIYQMNCLLKTMDFWRNKNENYVLKHKHLITTNYSVNIIGTNYNLK